MARSSTSWLLPAAALAGLGGALAWAFHAMTQSTPTQPRERKAVGYDNGKAFEILVTEIDGKPVEVGTAKAFRVMAKAAAAAGAHIKVNSGFRTMEQQTYLYNCYLTKGCNNGNPAAKPGYSNHQSGTALDLNTKDPKVGAWMKAHGNEFHFYNTVPSEPWHWQYKPEGA